MKVTAPTGVAGTDLFSPVGTAPQPAIDSIVNAAGQTSPATVAVNANTGNQNAGVYLPASLSGHVFNDVNQDGTQEAGDANLPGVTVELLNASGTVLATTTTAADGSGNYQFTNLAPGSYQVQVVAPAGDGYTPNVGTNANPAIDSITNATGLTPDVTLSSGGTATNQNGGVFVAPVTAITGHVFVDNACTDLYHVGDAFVPGVTVDLVNAAGKTVEAVTTDKNGDYSFGGVTAGIYTERFILPAGLSFDKQRVGTDDTLNSAPDPVTGITAPFTVAGTNVNTENAGVYLNGNFAGATPTTVGDNQSASFNNPGAIVVGGSNDNIHTTSGSNFVTIYEGSNVFESGSGTDVVYSCGTLNAQALGSGTSEGLGFSDYIFGGFGPNDLQGGAGSDYLMGGPGNDLIAGGNSGPNVLIGGGNTGTVTSQTATEV